MSITTSEKFSFSSQFILFEASHKPTPYREHFWEFKWRRKLIRNSANTAKVDLSSQFILFETSHKPTPYREHFWEFKWRRKLIRNSANTAKVHLSSQFSLFVNLTIYLYAQTVRHRRMLYIHKFYVVKKIYIYNKKRNHFSFIYIHRWDTGTQLQWRVAYVARNELSARGGLGGGTKRPPNS